MNYLENIIKFSDNIGIKNYYILPAHKLLDQKKAINNKKAKDLFKKVALNISKQYFITENIKFNINEELINNLAKHFQNNYFNDIIK